MSNKKLKRKNNHKDWKKRSNILKNWRNQHKNEGIGHAGGLPVHFPKKRKFISKKK